MKTVAALKIDPKSVVDRSKGIYRGTVETIARLDELYKKRKSPRDVFNAEAVDLRNGLKDYCERLMFLNPIEFGRKAEEVLWRKVFYQIIHMLKHKKRITLRQHGPLETAYRTHLSAALGYYQHLLLRLQREFRLCLSGVLDFHLMPDIRSPPGGISYKMWTSAAQEWAHQACHRCLICLGDIARYQRDTDHVVGAGVAQRFYHQALTLFPDIGMPHNQLGTLAGSRHCYCEAAYHYLRCLSSDKPFDGALANVKRLFVSNQLLCQKRKPVDRNLLPDLLRHEDIQEFLVEYLKLVEILFEYEGIIPMSEMQALCQQTLQRFNLCMFYERPIADTSRCACRGQKSEQAVSLDDDIVFKIVTALISLICLLQKKESTHVTVTTALLLALFSHTLNHVISRLQSAVYEHQNPNRLLNSRLSEEQPVEDSSDCLDDAPPNEQLVDCCDEEIYASSANNTSRKSVSGGGIPASGGVAVDDGVAPDDARAQSKRCMSLKLRNSRRRRHRRPLSVSSADFSDMSDSSEISGGPDDHAHEENGSGASSSDLVSYFDCKDSNSDVSDMGEPSDVSVVVTSVDSVTFSSTSTIAVDTIASQQPAASCSGVSSNAARPKGHCRAKSGSGDWTDLTERRYLASMSSELFLGKNMFLHPSQHITSTESRCGDFVQAKASIPVPPGFVANEEARHVADITEKLVNFVIETDTEIDVGNGPTDAELSGMTDTDDAVDINSSNTANRGEEAAGQSVLMMLDILQHERLLSLIKVMCDWIISQPAIISACAQSSLSLWLRLAVLFNMLPHEDSLVSHGECNLDDLQVVLSNTRSTDWSQLYPLTEDIEMCQMPVFTPVHADIDFTASRRAQLTELQEVFIRISAIRHFGYFLSNMDDIDFTYNEKEAVFFGPAKQDDAGDETLAQERLRDADSRRNQLMCDMAHLRLQAEVSHLEGCLQSNQQQPHFPPYAVVDAASLYSQLSLVQEVVMSARCILIIPLAVIDRLDVKKKESSAVREAIRWLEAEFRTGNRYIRVQKRNETVYDKSHPAFRKRYGEIWYLMEIIGCGRYLAKQSSNFGVSSVVVILTAHTLLADKPSTALRQVCSDSLQEGVSIERIKDFVTKWCPTDHRNN